VQQLKDYRGLIYQLIAYDGNILAIAFLKSGYALSQDFYIIFAVKKRFFAHGR
jgi:hypothetical protein